MVSVDRQPQFLRRIQNRPALRRRSGLVVFLQLALVASGVAVGGGLAYVVHRATAGDDTFRVRALELSGVPTGLRAEVARRLEWARGRNLLTADLDAVRSAVETVPEVAAARVRRLLPAALEIEVDLRTAAARLVSPDGAWAVSRDGVILGAAPAAELPEIRVDEELAGRMDATKRLPEPVDERAFERAVAVHEALAGPDAPVVVDHVRLEPRGLLLALRQPALNVLVSDAVDLRARIALLDSLRARAPLPATAVVDLRYPEMVILSDPDAGAAGGE